jgi:hypothetical protein
MEIDVRRNSRTAGLSVSKSGILAHLSISTSDSITAEMGFLALKTFRVTPEAGRSDGFIKSIADAPTLTIGRSKVQQVRLGESGRQLCLGYQNGELHLLNAADGSSLVEWSREMGPAAQLAFDERRARLAVINTEGTLRILRTTAPPSAVTGSAGGRKGSPGLHAFFPLSDELLLGVWDGAELDTGSSASWMDRSTGDVKARVSLFGGFSEEIITQTEADAEWDILALHRALLRSPPVLAADGRYVVGPGFSGLEMVPVIDGQARVSRPLEQRLEKASMAAVAAGNGQAALVRVSAETFEKLDAEHRSPRFHQGAWLLETGRLEGDGEFKTLWQGDADPRALTYSPDGNWLAFADGRGPARIWNVRTMEALQVGSSSRQAKLLSFLPDSSGIMVWSEDETEGAALEFRSLRSKAAKSLGAEMRGATILRSLAPGRAAVGNREGVLALVDLERGITHVNAGPAGSAVVGLEVSADGKTLLVNRVLPTGEGYCTLADAEYGHDILELTVDDRSVLAAAFLSNDRGVVMVGDDLQFYAWRLPPEN